MSNNEALKTLLIQRLDPNNDEHWTGQGLPRIDSANELLGAELTRQQITDAAPDLTRESLLLQSHGGGTDGTSQESQGQPGQGQGQQAGQQPSGGPAAVDGEPTDDELMAMPTTLVMSSRKYLERVIVILSQRSNDLQREKTGIEEQLKSIHHNSEIATRQLQRMGQPTPGEQNQIAIRQYLDRSRQSREVRSERRQKFVAAGTTAADVAEELRTESRLDAAMNQRKAPLGSQRPAPRAPGQ